ncbi:MAG: flagellar biosynthesis anti-sigma factor FlgM [Deltaproteobacteria bacterium]|nr:flagellar biosynthesis anti-sigma factor FlgM [Deltaproteobacteria bacterium]
MKLNDISQSINNLKGLDSSSSPKEHQPPQEVEKVAPPTRTEVDLSDKSVEFSRATELMHQISEDHTQKIEDLKTKVRDGSYNVESKDIASKIIEHALTNIVNPE